ncbi:hypothetical protein G7Y79_00082g100870 [Physcia stellaris]|nr:hypothetical protein G7Y79_00082g100870 [Physcia stellaris]
MTHALSSLPPDATGTPPWGSGEPPWGSGRPPWVTAMATTTLARSLPTSSPSSVSSAVDLLVTTAASATSGSPPTTVMGHEGASHISSFPGALIQGPSSKDINLLIGVPCLFLALCNAAVIGRFCARHMARLRLEADDWMALVALVLLTALSIEQFVLAHYLTRWFSDGSPTTALLDSLGRIGIADQMTYNFLITAARLSVLLLYRRIFSLVQRWFRYAWWSCFALILGYCIALLVGFLTACHGISQAGHICRNHYDVATKTPMIVAWLNIGVDTSLLVLPMRMVWMLQLAVKRKIGVCAMFALGTVGVAVSVARATVLVNMKQGFGGGYGTAFACWTVAEPAVALLCANLPLLRPLFANAYSKLSTIRNRTTSTTSDNVTLVKPQMSSNAEHKTASVSPVSTSQGSTSPI